MSHFEKMVSSTQVYKGKFIEPNCDRVELENGKISTREYLKHPGAVVVLAKDGDDLIFVKQYRYAVGMEMLEAPAGKLEIGEDPAEAAARELSEETGMECENLILLGSIYSSPGILSEKLYIYFADNLKTSEAHPDEDEFLSVERRAICDVPKLDIQDAKTICAIHMAMQQRLI